MNEIDPLKWYTVKELANLRLLFGYTTIQTVNSVLDNGIGGVNLRQVRTKGTVRKIQGLDLIDFLEKCKT